MELYIIRHAQSINNALSDQRFQVCDPPLTELGKQQAKIVAQHLVDGVNPEYIMDTSDATCSYNRHSYDITRLYCSPMWRALQTTQPIGQALGIAPEVWIDIHEQGGIFLEHGDERGVVGYRGKTRSEILAHFSNYRLPEEITELGWWTDGYEDWPTCYGRAIKVAKKLQKWADRDERIAIVSHLGFIDALLKAIFNQLPGDHLIYYHYNTAINRIDFWDDGLLKIRCINRIDHLPTELIS